MRQRKVPSKTIDQTREMYSRSGLGRRIDQTAMFFSPRNFDCTFKTVERNHAEKDERIKQKLRFAFTAILPRASKPLPVGAPKRPLNAQNQLTILRLSIMSECIRAVQTKGQCIN